MRLIPKRPHLPRVTLPRLTSERVKRLAEFIGLVAVITGVGMIHLPSGVILGGISVFAVRAAQFVTRREASS